MITPQAMEQLESRRLLTATTTLVNFGDSAGNNVYGTGWTTPIYGEFTSYSADGPDGIIGTSTGAYFAAGVSGATGHLFTIGDQIKVTWYNRSGSGVNSFTPRISFNDPDQSNGGVSGTWINMDTINVPAGQSVASTYTIDSTWAGVRSLINAHRNVNGTGLLLDKIEWVTPAALETVTIVATDSAAAEPSNTGTFTVTRTGSTASAMTVNYSVAGTATNGTDYTSLSGTVSIGVGQSSAIITVTPTDDSIAEGTETVSVSVAAGSGYIAGNPGNGVVQITDNDIFAISGVSGIINHRQPITITGSSFGAGPTDVVFDDFEDGVVGTPVLAGTGSAMVGMWSGTDGVVTYTDSDSVSGNKSFVADMSGGYSNKVVRNFAPGTNEVFASWWVQIPDILPGEGSIDGLNWKHVWINGATTGDDDITMTFLNSNAGILIAGNAGPQTTYTDWSLASKFARGDWIRMSFHIKGGLTDGSYQLKMSNPRNGESATYTMASGKTWGGSPSPNQYETINFNGFGRQTSGSFPRFDDTYSASGTNARARVEIGNAAVYANCTQLSASGFTSWNGTSINAKLNFGGLDTSSQLYLFVIDANGNATAGYPLTVSQAPTAYDDSYKVNMSTALTVATGAGVRANDIDLQGQSISVTKMTDPAHGSVTLNSDGSFVYTPDTGYYGHDSFTYRVSDGTNTGNIATVNLSVRSSLVNYGSAVGNNTYGTSWTTVLKGPYVGYSASGPAGLEGGSTGTMSFQGLSGSARTFTAGETIFVTWYNTGSTATKFTPKISFNDPDATNSGTSGTWYDMTPVTVGPGQSFTNSYTLAAGGSYSLININRGGNNLGTILCDKIEISSLTDLSESGLGSGEESFSSVAGRHLFYNNSAFDGNNAQATAADDGAIAPDKQALLPGQTATFANYSSYSRGLNGIIVDIKDLPASTTLTADDFAFAVSSGASSSIWANAPAPLGISVRRGAGVGGSDRVTIRFADNTVQKQWLQVKIKASLRSGLAADDVFYFGNVIGEMGNAADLIVNSTDLGLLVNHYTGRSVADIRNTYDINRDGMVNATDLGLLVNHYTGRSPVTALVAKPLFSQQAISAWALLSKDSSNGPLS